MNSVIRDSKFQQTQEEAATWAGGTLPPHMMRHQVYQEHSAFLRCGEG